MHSQDGSRVALDSQEAESAIDAFYAEVGRRVRAGRMKLDLKQEDLARELGLARSSVANLEAGRQRVPTHTLLLAAGVLRVRLDDLLPDFDRQLTSAARLGLPGDTPPEHLELVERMMKSPAGGRQ